MNKMTSEKDVAEHSPRHLEVDLVCTFTILKLRDSGKNWINRQITSTAD